MGSDSNPYTAPTVVPSHTRLKVRIAHRLLFAAFVVALIALWDPPPQPRYDGSWDPATVALVAFVFYGWNGAAVCILLGLASFIMSCRDTSLKRGSRRWHWVYLNVIVWFCLYASIPLWNYFIRQPEW